MKYKLIRRDGLSFPEELNQPYSDDNTQTFGGPLGQCDDQGALYIWVENIVATLTKGQQLSALSTAYKAQVIQINSQIMTAVVVTKDYVAETTNRNLLEQARLEYNINVGVIKNG